MNLLKKQAELCTGKRILDVGFAQDPNYFLKGEIIGIDIQQVTKPKNYSEALVVDLNKKNIPFKDKDFNTVILGSCIEHVENPSHLLRESNRVLKDQGKLVLTVPHASEWWTIIHNWFFPFIKDQDEGEHLSNWTKLDMIRLIKANGFKVKKIHGTFLRIPLLPWLKIPVGPFPLLGWAMIFEAKKIRSPKDYVLTREKDGKFIKV